MMRKAMLALLAAVTLSACAGDRLLAEKLSGSPKPEKVAALCALVKADGQVDVSGLCAEQAKAKLAAAPVEESAISFSSPSRSYRDHSYSKHRSYDRPVRVSSCQGLCQLQRFKAARSLDRKFNTGQNAGVNGWFGPDPGTNCTGLCSI